ncbi:uncharacterized protein LOC141829941 [Curcuma longa]|uniref:uncharacterized protein LOC141829941 n=1 Tax=Curcuma longa TaxID=136217 RepID=UPI003D9E63A6
MAPTPRGRGRPPRQPARSEEPDIIEEERELQDQDRDAPIGEQSPPAQVIPPVRPTSALTDKSRIMTLAKSAKERFTLFHGGDDPWKARSWMENLLDTYDYMDCTDAEKVGLATYHLRDEALTWWKTQKIVLGERGVTWTSFREAFEREFFPATFRKARRQEFLSLKQGERSVTEYNSEFKKLSEFCPQLVAQDEDRMDQFMQGLAAYIRDRMSGSSISSYREALDRALAIELTRQQISKEKEKEVGKPNAQGKTKSQDSQPIAQKRQRIEQSSGGQSRSTSYSGQRDQNRKCNRCGSRSHMIGDCPLDQPICYYCKLPGHTVRDCTLKAQLESTGAPSGERPTQQRSQRTQRPGAHQQQRPLPSQPQMYMIQGRDHAAPPTTLQYSTNPETGYSTQHYVPAVPQAYMLPAQQPQLPAPQSQFSTEWRPSTSQPIAPSSSTEVGRVYTTTHEEAQRTDGSVTRG